MYSRLRSKANRKSTRRRMLRIGFATINTLLLAAVLFFVLHARTTSATSSIMHSNTTAQAVVNPLDQVSSADIAVTVSRMSGLAESTAIKNQSESDDIQLAAPPINNDIVSKPQVPATAFKSNKDIQPAYVVQPGETITSIAAKFSVTSDSIRWSNNLTGDTVAAGTKLAIPPVGLSGIVYTVKAGDTLDSIATKYKADKTQLTAANDAEINGITVGEQIIIPNGQQPVVTYSNYYASGGFAWGTSAIYGYNGYDFGYCTWYVATRRSEVGMPLPANLGNASSWGYIARSAGLATGNTPKQYAAAVTSTYGEGHVAFVEAVNPDGSVVLSEMNVEGWDVKDTKTVSADEASRYTYIY